MLATNLILEIQLIKCSYRIHILGLKCNLNLYIILWLKTFSYKRRNLGFHILVHPDTNLHENDFIFWNLFKISLTVFFQMLILTYNKEKKFYEDQDFVHQEPSKLKKLKFYDILQSGKNHKC